MSTPVTNCPVCGDKMEIQYVGEHHDKKMVCRSCGTMIEVPDAFERTKTVRTTKRGIFGTTTTEEVVQEGRSDLPHGGVPKQQPQGTGFAPKPSTFGSQQQPPQVYTFQMPNSYSKPATAQSSSSGCGCVTIFIGLIVLVTTMVPLIATGVISASVFSDVEDAFKNVSNTLGISNARQLDNSRPLDLGEAVNDVVYTPDGTKIIAVGEEGTLSIWDSTTYREIVTLTGIKGGSFNDVIDLDAVAVSPDGKIGAYGGWGKQVYFFDPNTGERTGTIENASDDGTLTGLEFTADGSKLVVLGSGSKFYVIDMQSRRQVLAVEMAGFTQQIAVYGDWVAASISSKGIYVYDINTGDLIRTINIEFANQQAVAFSPDGKYLATGVNTDIFLYDTSNWKQAKKFTYKGTVFSLKGVTFSPTGKYIAGGDFFSKVAVWEVKSGDHVLEMSDLAEAREVVFSPNGRQVLSIGSALDEGTLVRLWEAFDGSEADNGLEDTASGEPTRTATPSATPSGNGNSSATATPLR